MSTPRLLLSAIFVITIATAVQAAAADATKRQGKFGEWESFSYAEGSARTCYIAASAGKVQGGEKGKTTTYLIVTHRSGGKSIDEVSVNGAYAFKKDSEVELRIGTKQHALFTKGDRAWAKDVAADKAIVAALARGKDASMHATPAKGSEITATFSLSGFSDALASADKACGVKRP
ncbi:MAG: invasion associated locus B family protein [Phaeospirillum sp.]|nr:invasion associated locus B family protein [Phaeospirillum sp.]